MGVFRACAGAEALGVGAGAGAGAGAGGGGAGGDVAGGGGAGGATDEVTAAGEEAAVGGGMHLRSGRAVKSIATLSPGFLHNFVKSIGRVFIASAKSSGRGTYGIVDGTHNTLSMLSVCPKNRPGISVTITFLSPEHCIGVIFSHCHLPAFSLYTFVNPEGHTGSVPSLPPFTLAHLVLLGSSLYGNGWEAGHTSSATPLEQ